MTRPNTRRIAGDKSIAIAQHADERVAPVPIGGSGPQHAGGIDFLVDPPRNLWARPAGLAQTAVDLLMLVIEAEADSLEDRLGIGGKNGMLTNRNQAII